MRRRFSAVCVIVVLTAMFCAPKVDASLKDLFQKVCTQLDELNKNMSKVGENWSKNFKEGGFAGAMQGAVSDLGAANSANEEFREATVASFKQVLKDFICFIPRTIKAIWDGFVDFLVWLRNLFLGTPPPSGDASRSFSESFAIGQGFEKRFNDETDFGKCLEHYLAQSCACDEVVRSLAGQSEDVRRAVGGKLLPVQDETAVLEGLLQSRLEECVLDGTFTDLETLLRRAGTLPGPDRRPLNNLLRACLHSLNQRPEGHGFARRKHRNLVRRLQQLLADN